MLFTVVLNGEERHTAAHVSFPKAFHINEQTKNNTVCPVLHNPGLLSGGVRTDVRAAALYHVLSTAETRLFLVCLQLSAKKTKNIV